MRFSTTLFLILTLFFAILMLAEPILVKAQGEGECPSGSICIDNPLKQGTISDIINAVTGLLQTIAIPIGVLMVVWGGIQIMTAAGSEEKVTQGKKTIMWTVVGVAIVTVVKFIVGFVTELLGGA